MTRNNLEPFNKSSTSLILCFLWLAGEPLQYLVQAAAGLALLSFPGLGDGAEGNHSEFGATDHSKAFGKSASDLGCTCAWGTLVLPFTRSWCQCVDRDF